MKTVRDYQLIEKIGEGNYGEIYRGVHMPSGRAVAVKSMRKSRVGQQKTSASEIEILRAVDHPNILKLFDFYETSNNFYIFLEYCGGGDLEEYVNINGRVSESLAKRWLLQLLDAFIELTNKKIMHRDIKLANIMLTDRSENADAKLGDFGFARVIGDLKDKFTRLGTPLFMAPEVLRGEPYDYKADVWSFGILCYEIMIGTSPFNVTSLRGLMNAQTERINIPPDAISEIACDFILSLLQVNANERPTFEQARQHLFFNSPSAPRESLVQVPVQIPQHLQKSSFKLIDETMLIDFKRTQIEETLELIDQFKSLNEFSGLAMSYYCSCNIKKLFEEVNVIKDRYSPEDDKDNLFSNLYENIQLTAAACDHRFHEEGSKVGVDVNSPLNDHLVQLLGQSLLEAAKEYHRQNSTILGAIKRVAKVLIAVNFIIPDTPEALSFWQTINSLL